MVQPTDFKMTLNEDNKNETPLTTNISTTAAAAAAASGFIKPTTIQNIVKINSKDSSYYIFKSRKDHPESKRKTDEKELESFRKRITRLHPNSYKDEIENEQKKMYNEYIKLFDWSIQTSDTKSIKASIIFFTHSYMELKYPFTRDQYEYLIEKLFQLLFQYVNDVEMELSIMSFLIILLFKGKKLINITIEWKPLYVIFKSHYRVDQAKTLAEDDTKIKSTFYKLVMVSRAFFRVEAFKEIHDEVKEYLVPHSNYMFFGVSALNLFLPTHHLSGIPTTTTSSSSSSGGSSGGGGGKIPVPDQILEYLAIWNWVESLSYWDEKWTDLFFRFIKYGQHFDWNPLSKTLYTLLTRLLDVAIGTPTMSHVKPLKLRVPDYFKSESDAKYKYSCIAKIFIYLINDDDDDDNTTTDNVNNKENLNLVLLKSLISKISIYFHPSNQGDWSSDLAEFLLTLCHYISKRHTLKPLSDKIISDFIEIVYQPLVNTLYSKKKHFILSACKVIKDLSYISPNLIFPKLIENFYSSFESEEEVNRIISTIEIISTCFHPLITSSDKFPEGKSHVYNLMELVITGLDPSYPNKSSAAFKFFYRLFSCVLLSDESQKEEEEQFKNEFERTTTMSTSSFSDWSILFIDSVIKFIMKVAKVSENGKSREIPPGMFLPETLELFFSQTSDEIYNVVLDRLSLFFTKTFEPDYYKQFGCILESITLRNPKKSLSKFVPLFIGKLISSKSSSPSTILELSDQEYKWYLTLLGYVIFKAGSSLNDHKTLLMESLYILSGSDNQVIIKFTGKVIRKLIFSLSRTYPSNNRSAPLNVIKEKTNHIKYWGTTDENIIYPIEWFEPTQIDISFAKELIQVFLLNRVKDLNDYLQLQKQKPILQQQQQQQQSGNNSPGIGSGSNTPNKLIERMKILNQLKLIHSVLRSSIFLLPRSSSVINYDHEESFKYKLQHIHPTYGLNEIQEFSKAREFIYDVIHSLLIYIRERNDEEVSILQAISKLYIDLFNCKKDIQNPVNESLFGKWKNLKRFKTRNSIIFKGFEAHLNRQNVHSYFQPITKDSKSAFLDLMDLSVHRYREVRRYAQNSLKSLLFYYPMAKSKIMIPILMKNIVEKKSDQEIKGTIYMLSIKSVFKLIKENWHYQRTLLPVLLVPLDHEKFKPTTLDLVNEFKKKFVGPKYKPQMFLIQSKEMLNLNNMNNNNNNMNNDEDRYSIIVPNNLIEKSREFIIKRNQSNSEALHYIMNFIIELLVQNEKTDTINWKDHVHLLGSLIYHLALIMDAIPSSGFSILNLQLLMKNADVIKKGVSVLIKNTTIDYPITRMLSITILSQMFDFENTQFIEFCHNDFWKYKSTSSPMITDNDNNNELKNQREKIQIFFSTVIGFFKEDISNLFNKSSTIEKIIKFQLDDHDTEGITHKISVAISNKALSGIWPNTRSVINVQYFKIPNAKFFFGLLNILGVDPIFEKLKEHMESLKNKTTKEEISLLSEMIGGIGRFIVLGGLENKDNNNERYEEIKTYLSDVLFSVLSSYSNECIETYKTAIRYISHNVKYNRVEWLSDCLFKLYNSSSNISTLSKSINFLRALLAELTWKSNEFLEKLLVISTKEFSNPYKQVRYEACRLLIRVLNYQLIYPTSPSNGMILFESPILPESSVLKIYEFIKDIESPHVTEETKVSLKENLMVFVQSIQSKGFPNLITRILPNLIKLILSLASDPKKEILEFSGICILSMSQSMVFDRKLLSEILEQLRLTSQSSFWKVRKIVLPFLQIFYFNHSLYFSPEQIEASFQLVINLIKDSHIEVREFAKTTLASLLISSPVSDANTRIRSLMESSIKTLNSLGKTSPENLVQKHSCTLILSSIILSNPYHIPSYFPKILDELSRYSYSVQPIKSSCESTIIEFWRTHKDSFEQEKSIFSEEEIEIMRSTKVSPSYYA